MIDLHTHSTASDGTDSPGALVRLAHSRGLEALALTDHDTVAGLAEAEAESRALGLRFVGGIELSARLAGEPDERRRAVHLLGYFFAAPGDGFLPWLDSLRLLRRRRNQVIAARLHSLGYEVSLEEAEQLGPNVTGRPHFADLLVRKGYFPAFRAAFDALLAEGCPACVEREDPSPEEGIARLHAAGAVVSLAHPRRLNQPDAGAEEALIGRLARAGLDALEVWHPDHDARSRSRYRQLARKYGLAVTGGSDYHGRRTPDSAPGRTGRARAPLSLLDDLRRRAAH